MNRIHRIHRSPIARAALMLLSGAMLFACTSPTADDDDDDDRRSVEQSGSVCASACAQVTGCGACVAVDGECISEAECITGCNEDPAYSGLASCVDGASSCDAVAACFGGGEPESCAWTDDGQCDEPQGTGVCAAGTDVNDCNAAGGCEWANDGECDEPEGTGLCAPGTDGSDCSAAGGCEWANDGECDEPEGTGLCAPGTDGSDCY